MTCLDCLLAPCLIYFASNMIIYITLLSISFPLWFMFYTYLYLCRICIIASLFMYFIFLYIIEIVLYLFIFPSQGSRFWKLIFRKTCKVSLLPPHKIILLVVSSSKLIIFKVLAKYSLFWALGSKRHTQTSQTHDTLSLFVGHDFFPPSTWSKGCECLSWWNAGSWYMRWFLISSLEYLGVPFSIPWGCC